MSLIPMVGYELGMDRKPGPVLIDYARDGPSEDNSEPDPAYNLMKVPSKIPNGGWIVLGVLFVCSMFIVHAFINYAYNRDYDEMYSITNEMFFRIRPVAIHTFNLRCINTIQNTSMALNTMFMK